MTDVTGPPFRADHVGSLLRPAQLLEARARHAAGEIDDAELRAFVASTARALVERYPRTRTPWPCGVMDAGETPSMMTGTAGIGYAFLRAHDPAAVPSVLVMAPP